MFEKIDNWEELKRPLPGKVDTNTFDSDFWTILATLDSDENIGIRIKFEELKKEDIRARNFPEFGEINIFVPEEEDPEETYLEIRLKNSYFKKQFQVFKNDILSESNLCRTEQALLEALYVNCKNWKEFLKGKRIEKLDPFKQKGLIGELLFLEYLSEKIPIRDCIEAWKGSDKYAKDFLISSLGFEIKSKSPGVETVKISSETQLHVGNLNQLFLIIYLVDKTPKSDPKGRNLSKIVDDLREIISNKDINSLQEFNSKLQEASFFDHHDYSKDFWLIDKNFSIYLVDDEFPKITIDDIETRYIKRVNYEVILNELNKYELEIFNRIFD